MQVVPYDFRPARFQYTNQKGYWVKLYLIFDGETTFTFYHHSEWLENSCLARELGTTVYTFTYDILVTQNTFPKIFNDIETYVSQSSSG